MAYMPKARDLEQPLVGATIRLAKRESFDARKAMAAPSATGGAPTQSQQASTPALPKGPTQADMYYRQRRSTPADLPVLPFLLKGRRSIEEYNDLNPGFAETMAQDFMQSGVTADTMDAMELAKRTVAAMHRWMEPTSTGVDLPTEMYRSANARRVAGILADIRRRRQMR